MCEREGWRISILLELRQWARKVAKAVKSVSTAESCSMDGTTPNKATQASGSTDCPVTSESVRKCCTQYVWKEEQAMASLQCS